MTMIVDVSSGYCRIKEDEETSRHLAFYRFKRTVK